MTLAKLEILNKASLSGERRIDFSASTARLKRLRKKAEWTANIAKTHPSAAKAVPFQNSASHRVFPQPLKGALSEPDFHHVS
jgi:hypothetical protein